MSRKLDFFKACKADNHYIFEHSESEYDWDDIVNAFIAGGLYADETLNNSLDTIVLNQYYDKTVQPYLDRHTFVGFGDYNFDEEDELVICGSIRPFRDEIAERWLDCESFTFYKDIQKVLFKLMMCRFIDYPRKSVGCRCSPRNILPFQ